MPTALHCSLIIRFITICSWSYRTTYVITVAAPRVGSEPGVFALIPSILDLLGVYTSFTVNVGINFTRQP